MALALSAAASACTPRRARMLLIGDSTVATYRAWQAPRAGWGQALQRQLRNRMEVLNLAVPGYGTRRFDQERWSDVRRDLRPVDHLLMQFGHVDALPKPTGHAPASGLYLDILSKFVNDTLQVGASPVLVTPIATYRFVDGKVAAPHAAYVHSMRTLAHRANVPLVDLNALSTAAMEHLGELRARDWFMVAHDGSDIVHLTTIGAEAIATLVHRALADLGLLG